MKYHPVVKGLVLQLSSLIILYVLYEDAMVAVASRGISQ